MSLIVLMQMKRKTIINKLKKASAVSEKSAKTLAEIGINDSELYLDVIRKLLQDNKLIKTGDGKYYINKKDFV